MDETHLVNDAKERLCYVSLDAANDFALSRFRGKRKSADGVSPNPANAPTGPQHRHRGHGPVLRSRTLSHTQPRAHLPTLTPATRRRRRRPTCSSERSTLRREFIMPDYVTNFRGRIREPHNLDPSFAPSAKSGPEKAADVGPPKKKANTSSDEQAQALAHPSPQRIQPPPSLPPLALSTRPFLVSPRLPLLASQPLPPPALQVLALSSERISVPEVFFCPSDIGIDQAGLAECCVQAVGSCLPDIREALYSNIILTGGSTLFPNLQKRLERELRETVLQHI